LAPGGGHTHINRASGPLQSDSECSECSGPGSVPGLQKRRIRRRRGEKPFSVVAGKETDELEQGSLTEGEGSVRLTSLSKVV
jgi:hypothetical protein